MKLSNLAMTVLKFAAARHPVGRVVLTASALASAYAATQKASADPASEPPSGLRSALDAISSLDTASSSPQDAVRVFARIASEALDSARRAATDAGITPESFNAVAPSLGRLIESAFTPVKSLYPAVEPPPLPPPLPTPF